MNKKYKKIQVRTMSILIEFILLSLLLSCGGGGGGGGKSTINNTTNAAPVIQSISANPSSVQIGGSVVLSCSAKDADNDPLSYSWNVTGGSLSSQTGATIFWTAPNITGNYAATCAASDGASIDSKTVTIAVTPPSGANHNPVIGSISVTPIALSVGGTAVVSVSASDPDGDTLGYSYSATGGIIAGSSSTASYSAPSVAGTYTIQVAITDGKGGSATGSVSVTVAPSSGGSGGTSGPVYEIEPNNDFSTAQLINANIDYIGGYSGPGDYSDYFKITATGSLMTVSLAHLTQNMNGSNFTVYIYNYSNYTYSTAGYFNADNGVNNSITIGAAAGQTYYIRIDVYNAQGYRYKLNVSFASQAGDQVLEVEPNNDFTTAELINSNVAYIGGNSGPGDYSDYFKVTATGNFMTVSLTHLTQNANGSNFAVYIYNYSNYTYSSAGYFAANNGINNSTTIGVAAGQAYYIRIDVNNAQGYEYQLRVSFS